MAKKILCIDDEPEVVEYLRDILQDAGYATCEAYDGKQGLEVAQREQPDLITLDLDMSKEWGTRFYRNLRRDPNLKDVPIVVVSALSGNKYAVKDAVANVDKPFTPQQILDVLKRILGE